MPRTPDPTAWRHRRPTVPGLYWWQSRPDREPHLVRLWKEPRSRFLVSRKWGWQIVDGSLYVYRDAEHGGGRWAGPVGPPADEAWPAVLSIVEAN